MKNCSVETKIYPYQTPEGIMNQEVTLSSSKNLRFLGRSTGKIDPCAMNREHDELERDKFARFENLESYYVT